jgi:hypothetical protein
MSHTNTNAGLTQALLHNELQRGREELSQNNGLTQLLLDHVTHMITHNTCHTQPNAGPHPGAA